MLKVNIKLFKDNTCKVEVNDTYSEDLSKEIATYFSNGEDYNNITALCKTLWNVEELTPVSFTSFLPKDKGRECFFTMLVKKTDFGINIDIKEDSIDMEADYLNEEDIYDLITEMVHESDCIKKAIEEVENILDSTIHNLYQLSVGVLMNRANLYTREFGGEIESLLKCFEGYFNNVNRRVEVDIFNSYLNDFDYAKDKIKPARIDAFYQWYFKDNSDILNVIDKLNTIYL